MDTHEQDAWLRVELAKKDQQEGRTNGHRLSGSLTIVTHCYAEHLPQYAKHLDIQIRSLRQWPPTKMMVSLVVCYTREDEHTVDVLAKYAKQDTLPSGLSVQGYPMTKAQLFRRAIGRNEVSRAHRSDLYWYTDADYFFGPGCIDYLAWYRRDSALLAPQDVWISVDHETGDKWLARHIDNPSEDIRLDGFAMRRQRVAIGGVQVVGGTTAREYGYLRGTRWIKEVDPAAGFRTCRCDRAYRGWLERETRKQAVPIYPPNLYRIRHTQDGRDFNNEGFKLGRKTW